MSADITSASNISARRTVKYHYNMQHRSSLLMKEHLQIVRQVQCQLQSTLADLEAATPAEIDSWRSKAVKLKERSQELVLTSQVMNKIHTELACARADLSDALLGRKRDISTSRQRVILLDNKIRRICARNLKVCITDTEAHIKLDDRADDEERVDREKDSTDNEDRADREKDSTDNENRTDDEDRVDREKDGTGNEDRVDREKDSTDNEDRADDEDRVDREKDSIDNEDEIDREEDSTVNEDEIDREEDSTDNEDEIDREEDSTDNEDEIDREEDNTGAKEFHHHYDTLMTLSTETTTDDCEETYTQKKKNMKKVADMKKDVECKKDGLENYEKYEKDENKKDFREMEKQKIQTNELLLQHPVEENEENIPGDLTTNVQELPWRAMREGSNIKDLPRVALDKLAARVHGLYEQVYHAAMISVKLEPHGDSVSSGWIKRRPPSSLLQSVMGSAGRENTRQRLYQPIQEKTKQKSGVSNKVVFYPKPIPPPQVLPITSTNTKKEYPLLARSFCRPGRNVGQPVHRLVDQHNLIQETKLMLYRKQVKPSVMDTTRLR